MTTIFYIFAAMLLFTIVSDVIILRKEPSAEVRDEIRRTLPLTWVVFMVCLVLATSGVTE